LRARPEPTQLKRLSDASFLGKLLMLPANVRLDWKVIAKYKHSNLFVLVVNNKRTSFVTLTPGELLFCVRFGRASRLESLSRQLLFKNARRNTLVYFFPKSVAKLYNINSKMLLNSSSLLLMVDQISRVFELRTLH